MTSRFRRVAMVLLPGLMLTAAVRAARAAERVIPPGQETLVETMLGGAEPLPGGCRLQDAAIEPQRIVARYACATGEVGIELVDVAGAAAGARRTAQFALRPRGNPPAGFLEALEARLRAFEAPFLWHRPDAPRTTGAATASSRCDTADRPARRGRFPWILAAGLLLAGAGLIGARPRARPTGLAFALWGGALALRTAFGPWGPFHVNGQGPAWLAAAIAGSGSLEHYGPGYAELFGPVARLWPGSPDTAIFLANAMFCAAIPALAWVTARLLRLDARVALGAAVLLAFDPVSVRLGATESYLPSIAALTLGAAALLLAAVRGAEGRRRWVAAAFGLAAALLGAQAARVHPLAWGPVALVPAVVPAAPDLPSGRRRLLWTAAAVALLGAIVALVSGDVVLEVLDRLRAGALMRPAAPSWGLPLFAAALVAAAVLATWRRPTRRLVLAAAPAVLYLAATAPSFAQSAIALHAYARVWIALPFLALAAHVPRRAALPVTAALALALVVGGAPVVRARTTEHEEYRWLRERLSALPAGCYVAHVSHAGSRTLYLPVFPPRHPLPFGEGEALDPRLLAGGRCAAYVHGSICTSPEGRAACAAFERNLELEILARTSFPAAPSFDALPYDRERVECQVARVRGTVGARERRLEVDERRYESRNRSITPSASIRRSRYSVE